MRKVIVNSTPIISLSKAGCLHLLKDLYGQISIPTAVKEEVTRKNDSVKAELENRGCGRILGPPVTAGRGGAARVHL